MRLVLSGYAGFDNIGDEAVLAGMIRTFRSIEPDLELTVLSGDPAATRRDHAVEAIRRMDVRVLARALRRADGLVSGGGSLLQDRTSARPVAYYAGVMHLARLLGRPYVVHAQGLGPIRRRPNRWIAASALRGAAAVSLRDHDSLELARALGVRRPIEVVPDPALALTPPAAGGPEPAAIVVAVRDWPARSPYLASIRDALARLEPGPILALPMQGATDLAASRAVVDGLAGARVAEPPIGLDGALAAIGSARLVVGMRLHALILAAGAGVPGVAISYDPKVDAFAARAGQPIGARVDEPIDPGHLATVIGEALAADRAALATRVTEMRADLERSAAASLDAIRAARKRR